MPLLPANVSFSLTWVLCSLLLAWLLIDWQREWVRKALFRLSQNPQKIRRQTANPTLERLNDSIVIMRARVLGYWGNELKLYSSVRALRRVVLMVPLAVVFAKAATDDKVWGVFAVFRDHPQTAEQLGRCLLILLIFVGLVRAWPRLDLWGDSIIARASSGSKGGLPAIKRFLTWMMFFCPFYLIGLTPAFVLILGMLLAVDCYMALQKAFADLENCTRPMAHAGLQLMLMVSLLAILLPLHLLWLPQSGLLAALLFLGIVMPLAAAPAGIVAQVRADKQVQDLENWGSRSMGPVRMALQIVGTAVLSLAMLALGLGLGLWLATVLAPQGYRPDLAALWRGVWFDPAMGGPIWILAGVVVLPLLALPAEFLAMTISHHSLLGRRAVALLDQGAPAPSIASALIASQITGWVGTVLVLGLPILVLAVLLARP